jgi:hypothetical protein
MKLLNMLPPSGDPARPVFIGAVYGLLALVLVFGTSAAICASETWSSPVTFVLATIGLPFLLLALALPTLVPIVIVWTVYRGVTSWLDQSQARQAALDALIARQRDQ